MKNTLHLQSHGPGTAVKNLWSYLSIVRPVWDFAIWRMLFLLGAFCWLKKIFVCYTLVRMFKNVIAPIQAWLLSQGRCVGCGRELSMGKAEGRRDGTNKIACACGRIFVHDAKTERYRRALLEEV